MRPEEDAVELQRFREGGSAPKLPVAEVETPFDAARTSSLSLSSLSRRDRRNFFFLTLLYFVQGIPVGLAFGSIPFFLKERLSYSQVGLFTFASYPYSLKLLWSPFVDGYFWREFGRRRSWIVPIQLFSTLVLLILSLCVGDLMANAATRLPTLTFMFGTLVFGSATQDIAVDGWALTLLSHDALSYASTAQTIGMNTGYFTSFTVFLALSSPEFANKYFRSVPDLTRGLVTLPGYLLWCAFIYFSVTLLVLFGGQHDSADEIHDDSVHTIYRTMLRVLKLPNMRSLVTVHLIAKIAFQAAEQVTNLKLLEKGLSKEDLALIVLIDFPFEIIFGYYAAKWSAGPRPLRPWLWAYVGRLVYACISMSQVYYFPTGNLSTSFFAYITLVHVLGSFLSTVQFVSVTAFHTRIADPDIGGTYMTVLNTLSNLGGQWPRFVVLAGVDWFTSARCSAGDTDCGSRSLKEVCQSRGGVCTTKHDGYYVMNIVCVTVGILLFSTYLRSTMERLQSLPMKAWRHKQCT